nr:hypothetical protein CFP56_11777 [Quercus suber]
MASQVTVRGLDSRSCMFDFLLDQTCYCPLSFRLRESTVVCPCELDRMAFGRPQPERNPSLIRDLTKNPAEILIVVFFIVVFLIVVLLLVLLLIVVLLLVVLLVVAFLIVGQWNVSWKPGWMIRTARPVSGVAVSPHSFGAVVRDEADPAELVRAKRAYTPNGQLRGKKTP